MTPSQGSDSDLCRPAPCAWCGTPTVGRRERPKGFLTPCCVDCLLGGTDDPAGDMHEPYPVDTIDHLPAVEKAATLSDDGVYRYTLTRRWGDGPAVLFVMLNPSTADADVDDPTIRRCIGFARSWGYEALHVWNIYAYRATDPSELDQVGDPIGHENEDHLWRLLQDPEQGIERIVAAWGAKPNRGAYKVRELMMLVGPFWERELYALGLTKDGHPRHPLYVKGDTEPVLWHGVKEPKW